MKSDLPPLNWLKTFEVAARLLNFSAAGRELNMTQSAVSQQIRLLEHHLGDPLFNRQHRRVTLTNSGMAYLPVVQSAIERLQRSTVDIFAPISKGQLVLEVNMAFAWGWLAPRLNGFCSRYPGLGVQLYHSNWERDWGSQGIDIAIRHGDGDWPGYVTRPLLRPQLKPYCGSQLARLIQEPVDLLSLPLIEVIGTRRSWKDWFECAGIADPGTVLKHKVDSVAMAIQMAQSGLGVFLGYEDFIAATRFNNYLAAPFDISVETPDNYYLIYSDSRPLTKSAAVFEEWFLQEMQLT